MSKSTSFKRAPWILCCVAALLIASVMSSRASAQKPYCNPTPIDHYQSYQIKGKHLEVDTVVQLTDQFQDAQFKVKKLHWLLNPVQKNHDGVISPVNNPGLHYSSYQVKGPDPRVPVVEIETQFGISLHRVGKPERLLVPAVLAPEDTLLLTDAPHFLCYQLHEFGGSGDDSDSDSGGKNQLRLSVQTLDPTLQRQALLDIKKPLRLCNPAIKIHDGVAYGADLLNPDLHLVCYQAKVKEEKESNLGITILDQFAGGDLSVRKTREICIPATKLLPGDEPPLREEICGDGLDNDCNGSIDEPEVCAVDCEVSEWSAWSECDPQTGTQSRSHSVTVEPLNGGAACPALEDSRDCAVDCEVSEWGAWSECDPTTGTQSRSRSVTVDPLNGGAACGALEDSQDCAVDCEVSEWGAWSACDSEGNQTRSRSVTVEPLNGGAACEALEDSQTCAVDCVQSEWSAWSACDSETGTQTRSRSTTQDALNGGAECGATEQEGDCAVDCEVSEWGAWSACDSEGNQTRSRSTTQDALNGGADCPVLNETETCGPVDCQLSEWSAWSVCDGGTQTRARSVTVAPSNGGAECGAFEQERTCDSASQNLGPPPVAPGLIWDIQPPVPFTAESRHLGSTPEFLSEANPIYYLSSHRYGEQLDSRLEPSELPRCNPPSVRKSAQARLDRVVSLQRVRFSRQGRTVFG